jgi:hypothetical protein
VSIRGYSYGATPALFRLRDNPDPQLGGEFADDRWPAVFDPIAGYGSIGFDQPGETACPRIPVPVTRQTWGVIKSLFR